ncbi:uncharacterized protein At1g66480-like [Rhodamnia argentea]|uniref:Uncharacterized protein At1g66480-like n=1 Tax=Rhodamnia argentea TaxID=178133 RepID=A0A8B8P314_9MYRT|nr:uncharacterized protein At1g66480-like [Rhodamnia argentea]
MGNAIGAKRNKTAKVMKISGETTKLRTPVLAGDVLRDYPGYVLLESEAVKHFGVRAKPLEARQDLEPKRLYFLVELPESSQEKIPRRVRSGISVSARDRLESLMLARRSVSDLSIVNPTSIAATGNTKVGGGGCKRLRMRLPKGEVERLMKESRGETEAAEKIMNLYIASDCNVGGGLGSKSRGDENGLFDQRGPWKVASHGRAGESIKTREKRVSFLPVDGGDKQIVVAS